MTRPRARTFPRLGGSACDAQNVRDFRHWEAWAEREAVDLLDLEAVRGDRGFGLAVGVAAAGDVRPHVVEEVLDAGLRVAARVHVLEEVELASRLDHAAQLR